MKGDELLKFKTVQKWFDSLNRSAKRRGKNGLTKNAKIVRLGTMWKYTEEGKLNPDKLLEEAQEDIDNAGKRLDKYFSKKLYASPRQKKGVMPRRRKLKQFFLGSGRLFDEIKDKLTDEELESMTQVAEYLGVSTEEEGLAERIGIERVGNKNLDEKVKQVQNLRDRWIMKKTKKGNTFISIGEVKSHKVGKYKRGRIQITVDPEWIGYTAMVVLSKTKIPKMKIYKEGEVTLDELRDEDPSDYADIVFEDKKEESESSNTTFSDRLVEFGRKMKELEESKKSKKIVVPKKGYMKTKMTSGTTLTTIGSNKGVLLTTCFFCLS